MLSLEYVAGLFDGEGCIRVETPGVRADGTFSPSAQYRRAPSFSVFAQIFNTYEPVIRAVHEQFGGQFYRNDYFTRVNRLNRILYEWRARTTTAYAFLVAVRPFLIIKREQADLAITLQEHIIEHKSRHTGPWATPEYRSEVAAHRKALADKIRLLKKLEHDVLPVGDGPVPHNIQ